MPRSPSAVATASGVMPAKVTAAVGVRSANRVRSVIPHTFAPGIASSPSSRRPNSGISYARIAAMPAWASSRRPVMPGNLAWNSIPNRRPTSAMYSTAAPAPAYPSKFPVPVSKRSVAGRSL